MGWIMSNPNDFVLTAILRGYIELTDINQARMISMRLEENGICFASGKTLFDVIEERPKIAVFPKYIKLVSVSEHLQDYTNGRLHMGDFVICWISPPTTAYGASIRSLEKAALRLFRGGI